MLEVPVRQYRWSTPDLLCHWWGEDCVVFNPGTGRTHQLDAVAGHALMALNGHSGLTIEGVFDAVFSGDPNHGDPLMLANERNALSALLEQLQALELLEPVPA